MNTHRYAQIAVNAPVKNTFDYHIPPELDGRLKPGHLVQVAFGTAQQHGIIVGIHDHTDIERTKPVRTCLDPRPVVTESQIDLAYWMRDQYLASLSACLWLMLPPGITGGRDVRVTLLNEDHQTDDELEQDIIGLLQRRGPLIGKQFSAVKTLQGRDWRKAVEALAKAEVVEWVRVLNPPRVRPKKIKTVTLAIRPDNIHAVARHLGKQSRRADLLEVIAASPDDAMRFDDALRMAGVSRSILTRLAAEGHITLHDGPPHYVTLETPPESVDEVLIELRGGHKYVGILERLAYARDSVAVKQLYADTGCSLNDLRKLEDEGLVIFSEAEVWRDSLAERDFVPVVAPALTPEQAAAWAVIEADIKRRAWETPQTPPPNPLPAGGEGENERAMHKTQRWHTSPKLWEALKTLARQKRHEPTEAEDLLWQHLRRNNLGLPFRRQHTIDRFIVDFFCPQAKLIVEVDGPIHDYTREEDAIREEFLMSRGFQILRFSNDDVLLSTKHVIDTIKRYLDSIFSPLSVYGEGLGVGLEQGASASPDSSEESRGEGFSGYLLHGVTGSGKTEIYLRAIELVLAQGRQAIFLVPEIALTPQTVRRVVTRFPGQVAVVHSGLSDGERYDTWRRAREGLIQVVVGARSALFTPLPDVGLIVLDEEHDHSYKQSPPIAPPYYHAREVAEEMMHDNNGTLILGSATPSLESYHRAQRGDLHLLELPQRVMGHRARILEIAEREGITARYFPASAEDAVMIDLPPVEVVDMRAELHAGNTSMFSESLHTALRETLEREEQAILFLNRRGTSSYVFCRDCGYVVACTRCDTPLTFHRHGENMQCHHCGYQEPQPEMCPECGSMRIRYFGAGTQNVEEALYRDFPKARIVRWDADTASNPKMHDTLLNRFIQHKADVMIGTQMIAKGLDLPLVTLVGVVSADVGLTLPDFRAGERAFQLLAQVSGRAGRGILGGKVILQTYQPQHYAVQAAAQHDYERFYEQEIAYRHELGYPPFRRLVRLVFRFNNAAKAQAEAERAATMLRNRMKELRLTGTELIGPAPCYFSRIDTFYRWHVLLRGPNPTVALHGIDIPPRGWSLDIDPVDVL